MGKRRTTEKRTRAMKQPLPAWAYGVSCLILVMLCVGLLLLFEPGARDRALLFMLFVLIALMASAFLFGFMRSMAWKKSEKGGGRARKKRLILEWGGPVVLFLPLLLVGLNWMSEEQPFTFTIFLRDAAGETVLKDAGVIKIRLDNEIKQDSIDENGSVDFKGIPAGFRDREVPVELEIGGWQFANGKRSTRCTLEGSAVTLTIERDDSLCCVSGLIMDDNGQPLAGVSVAIKGITTETDGNGRFQIRIPPEKRAEKQWLTALKEGYETHHLYVYPGQKSEVRFVLPGKVTKEE